MTTTMLAALLGLALAIAIAAVLRTWSLQSQLDTAQSEIDHVHSLAHGMTAALLAHIEGREIEIHPITIYPITLRDTEKE